MTDAEKLVVIRSEAGPLEWRRSRWMKEWRLYRLNDPGRWPEILGAGRTPGGAISDAYERLRWIVYEHPELLDEMRLCYSLSEPAHNENHVPLGQLR